MSTRKRASSRKASPSGPTKAARAVAEMATKLGVTAPKLGEVFEATFTVSAADGKAFARLVGDLNPLHHDEAVARASRFGGLILSGTHSTSVLMGVFATHYSERFSTLGLGYSVRLRKPVRADEPLTVRWHLIHIEASAKMKGIVCRCEGTLSTPAGVAITAEADALITGAIVAP